MLKGKTILLGVTGGIAAYKSASLASMLVKSQAEVHVLMTEHATNFITPITFETLTGNRCVIDTFDRNFEFQVEHVALAQKADAFVIAPATANVIAKIAHGMADDMLTTTLLACKCPKIIVPAMNTAMYENAVTQNNLEALRKYGMEIIDPASGRLACGDTGAGKMPEPETILQIIFIYRDSSYHAFGNFARTVCLVDHVYHHGCARVVLKKDKLVLARIHDIILSRILRIQGKPCCFQILDLTWQR